MAFDFPAAPTLNDEFTAAGITYVWNGQGWTIKPTASGGVPVDAYTKAESDGRFVNVPGDTMTGALTIDIPTQGHFSLNKGDTGTNEILGKQNGVKRWQIAVGSGITEAGGNKGSNFAIVRFDDAGNMPPSAGAPFEIQRDTGNVSFSDNQVQFINQATNWGYWIMAWPGSWMFSTDVNATAGQYMSAGGSAWVAISDARLPYKVSATPINNTLDRLAGVQLHHNVTPSGKDEVFFKAQELAASLPELVMEGTGPQSRDAGYVPTGMRDPNQWGIMYDRCGAVALQAVKELLKRIEDLEARLPQPK